jgi:phage terminase small subunit
MNHRKLTPRKLSFISAYLSGKGGAESAMAAGYSPGNARHRAYELLNNDPLVVEAIKDAQEKLRREANFNAEKAMDELNDAMKFARETKNATALARCIELRAKLAGLLDTRDKGPTTAFQINIAGLDTPEPAASVSIYD